jgi:hypothetical protein
VNETDTIFWVCCFIGWAAFWGGIGAVIGNVRGRPGDGFGLGLMLGPLGWIITLCLPHAGLKCPECMGVVPAAARRCRHCGSELVRSKIIPHAGEASYYVMKGEQAEGPFTTDQLRALLAMRKIGRETLCATNGGERWKPLDEII